MTGQRKKKRKKRSEVTLQRAAEHSRKTKEEKLRRRTRTSNNPFVYEAAQEASVRPASGGQEHSPRKVTADGVQLYEKSLISPLAVKALIQRGELRPRLNPLKRAGVESATRFRNIDGTLCLWSDSRESLHRLLTRSGGLSDQAAALAKGSWRLEVQLPRGIDNKRMRYIDAIKALIELDRSGYYEFRIAVNNNRDSS